MVRRKMRVVADWTVALFFRRDVAELSALGHPRNLGADEELGAGEGGLGPPER
jgi:hypothetical protein